jgi:hypothetical protein
MFAAMLALLSRYPELWTLVVTLAWVLVSSVFCSLYDRFSPHTDEEWRAALERHPVWNGIVSALKTGGINIPGFLRSIRVIVTRKPPAALASSRPPATLEEAKAIVRAAGLELMIASAPIPGTVEYAPDAAPGLLPPVPEPAPTPRESGR